MPLRFQDGLTVHGLVDVVMILAQALRHWFGQLDVYLLAAVARLSDVDAIARVALQH